MNAYQRLSRGQMLLALVALLFGLLASAHYYIQPPLWGKNFGLLDYRYYFGPNAFFFDTALNNGEFPFWNPMAYCGMPFAADPQTSVFYPPHMLRSFLTPAYNPYASAVSIHLMALLHVLAAGIGMVALARACRLSLPAGIAGAFVFMFGPFSVIYYTEFNIFPLVAAWTPWIFLAAHHAMHSTTRNRFVFYTLLCALGFGTSVLAGFPQLSLYLGLLVAIFALGSFVFRTPPANEDSAPVRRIPILIKGVVLTGAVAVLGALLGAVLLLPAQELGQFSARTAEAGLDVKPRSQSFDWVHLLKCLVVFPGNTWLPQGCRAAGIGSLLALIAAFAHPNRRGVLVYLILFLAMCDLTLGPPFPLGALLRSIDFLNITVSPWRAGIFSAFCLAMLVAFGVDGAGHAARSLGRGAVRTAVLLTAGVAMIGLLLYWLGGKPLFEPTYFVWLLPMMTLAAMCYFAWTRKPELGSLLIALLICLEILAWSGEMLPIYVANRLGGRSTAGFGEARGLWQTNQRPTTERPNWNLWTLQGASNGYGPLYVGRTRELLCGPARESRYSIILYDSEVEGNNQRGNLFAKRNFWLARQWVAGELPDKATLFPSATTVFLPETPSGTALTVPEIPRERVLNQAVSEDRDRIELLADGAPPLRVQKAPKNRVAAALPPAILSDAHGVLYIDYTASGVALIEPVCVSETGTQHFLYQYRVTDTRGAVRQLALPLPDCRRATVTLRWPEAMKNKFQIHSAYVLQDRADEDGKIRIVERRANSVEVALEALPEARILTFVDSAFPGWSAELDGASVPILRANDGFKAVAVPPGDHTVRFQYRPTRFAAGLAVTLFTLAAIVLTLVVLSRTARRETPPPAEAAP